MEEIGKILFVGIYAPGYSSDAMVNALKELHYDVVVVNWQSIRYSLGTEYLNHYILKEAERTKPEFIFMHIQNPDAINVATFAALQKISPVINYTFDVRLEHIFIDWYKKIAKQISLTCFAAEKDVMECKAEGISNVRRIHSSCDMDLYEDIGLRVDEKRRYPEIVFIGNNHSMTNLNFPQAQQRFEMVKLMKSVYGDRFGVYGIGWGNGSRHVLPNEEVFIYNSCKIALTHNNFDYDGYCSDRGWRAMACGAFTLNQYYLGIEKDLYWPVTWKAVEEIPRICVRVLTDTFYAAQIKKSNTFEVRTKHTWKARFKKIIKYLEVETNKSGNVNIS